MFPKITATLQLSTFALPVASGTTVDSLQVTEKGAEDSPEAYGRPWEVVHWGKAKTTEILIYTLGGERRDKGTDDSASGFITQSRSALFLLEL